jgi:hypothetical protein
MWGARLDVTPTIHTRGHVFSVKVRRGAYQIANGFSSLSFRDGRQWSNGTG